MSTELEIRPLSVKEASQAEYYALNQHTNRLRLERLPDDPPIPLDETIKNLQSLPPFVDVKMWGAWLPGGKDVAGMGNVVFLRTDDNKHLAQFEIGVMPEYRRQGLGRRLLRLIADATEADGRRLLVTDTVDRVPAGEIFMKRMGGQKGLETHTNQLRIADLDRSRLAAWLASGQGHSSEFEIGLWEGPYPEEKIQEIAKLFDLTNQQPFGDLEIEEVHMTPEQIRQAEQNTFARGNQRWTFYVIEKTTGKFAGYTETIWNPNRPEVLRQDMTGVFPEYRNKGLGRWLKTAMLDKVLRERPQVKFVRTGNADSNGAMLKINTELGFKPYMADTVWQVELQKVLTYLQSAHS